jgi:hypothetical protein
MWQEVMILQPCHRLQLQLQHDILGLKTLLPAMRIDVCGFNS